MELSPTLITWTVVVLSGLAVALFALVLRVLIHVGRTPSGVDTWYFLIFARQLRRDRSLPVRLRNYLLQDEEQSYPPLFPIFLSLLPASLLERYYWLVSPLLDCLHLLFLHVVAYKISASLPAAIVASLIYAVTPQLVSETRSLNSRAFGALVQSLAFMAIFRFYNHGSPWPWLALSLALAGAVFLSHSLTAISFGVTSVVLTAVTHDLRFLGILAAAPLLALLVTRGLYWRGVLGHLQSARFWRSTPYHRHSHQVFDSPVYAHGQNGSSPAAPDPPSPARWVAARLIGENPFIVSLLAATALGLLPLNPNNPWGVLMFWWAVGVFGWAVLTTFVRPLRVFGPGYLYIKTSTFPSAYTLGALVVGPQQGLTSPAAAVLLPGFLASFAALVVFYRHIRTRRSEHTASAPVGLQEAARFIGTLPGERVACLPTMYADYLAYQSGKKILWGGHSGDPARLDGFYPVITRPLQEFFRDYLIDYFVLDLDYVEPEHLALTTYLEPIASFQRFHVYQVRAASVGRSA